jgi:hypothetical protein
MSNFDTSSITDLSGIFLGCAKLTSIKIGKINTKMLRICHLCLAIAIV